MTETPEFKNIVREANLMKELSDDPDTQLGSVIFDVQTMTVIGRGANKFPSDDIEKTNERLSRPGKYHYMEHAESWAIDDAQLAQMTWSNKRETNLVLAATRPIFICSPCARRIVKSWLNIRKIWIDTTSLKTTDATFNEDYKHTAQIFDECGIQYEWLEV